MQNLLTRQGYPLEITGRFDEKTYGEVLRFQNHNGITADGIVGYNTWEKLFWADMPEEGKKAGEEDYIRLACLLEVEVAALKAVEKVECGGKEGFVEPGKPIILFEGHVFWKQLELRKINPNRYVKGNEDILYPNWNSGHYKGGKYEYIRLEKARAIHREAADASASWGKFQIMGFNYRNCGEKSVGSFVNTMCRSELAQFRLAGRFMKRTGILPFLRSKNWVEFACRYNGRGYASNHYVEKLTNAYKEFSRT